MIATSYPLLDAFWTMLWIVGFFLWIWIAIIVFADIFRSRDLSGWMKALWVIAIFALPLLGVLLYLIVRGRKMREHAAVAVTEQQAMTDQYIRSAAGAGGYSAASELSQLASLRDSGVLSQDEFNAQKARILASTIAPSTQRTAST